MRLSPEEVPGGLGSASLASLLSAEIAGGRYGIGSTLPSESDLCQRFGVSRHTVREAVRRLAQTGLVARRQGAGTRIVAHTPRAAYVLSLRSLSEVLQFTRETQLEIGEKAVVALAAADAAFVQAAAGSRWLRLKGVRRAVEGGDVICHSTIFAHGRFAAVLADVARPGGPIYGLIESRTGEHVAEASQEISGGPLPAEAARVLKMAGDATAIRVTRRYLDMSGGVMLASLNWHDPAAFSYVVSLRRDPAG